MVLVWIAIAILAYVVFSKSYDDLKVTKFINNLNDCQQTFSINLANAVLKNKLFLELAGFKDQTEEYPKWSKETKERWQIFLKKNEVSEKLNLNLTHLPVDDVFLVSYRNRLYPVLHEWKKRQLMFETLIGDSFSFTEPTLSICVVERFLMEEKIRVITGYLKCDRRKGEDSETILLFDFPYSVETRDEVYNKFSFTVNRRNSDPFPSDLAGFGERPNDMDMWNETEYVNDKNVKISTFV